MPFTVLISSLGGWLLSSIHKKSTEVWLDLDNVYEKKY